MIYCDFSIKMIFNALLENNKLYRLWCPHHVIDHKTIESLTKTKKLSVQQLNKS